MQGVMPDKDGQIFCSKCRKTMNAVTNFYTYRDKSKCELCKTCLTMHVNNWDPETYLWLLEKFDYPYIEEEWVKIRDKEIQTKGLSKINGMTVFGKYIAKMKLNQFKKYFWKDTEKLRLEREQKAEEFGSSKEQMNKKIEEMREAFERGEITEAQFKTYAETTAPSESTPSPSPITGFEYPESEAPADDLELEDIGAQLTHEDKVYLAMKWGKLNQPDEWVKLEKLYNEFMKSFDIQDAARLDTLKKICKTSVKMDEAIDLGDIESYQKLSRVYDSLMKSGKFQEQQRKEEKIGEFNSIGQVVAFAEKSSGKIPRHKIDTPLDIVDKAIMNLKNYTKELIVNDPSLSQMFENLVKRKEIVEQQKEDKRKMEEQGIEFLSVEDKDYLEFNSMLEMDRVQDKKILKIKSKDKKD